MITLDSFILHLTVLCHFIIILAYVGLGVYVWPKFDAAGPGWGVQAARFSGQIFFLTCAYTHGHELIHLVQGTPINSTIQTWHYQLAHILQAVSAPSALYFGWRYTSLRFVSPEIASMLDRMEKEAKDNLTRLKEIL